MQSDSLRDVVRSDPLHIKALAALDERSLLAEDNRRNLFLVLTAGLPELAVGHLIEHGAFRGGNALFVVTVADEDLHEYGVFLSKFNRDHRWTFKFLKVRSCSPRSLNVLDLIRNLGRAADPVKIELLASTYRFGLPRYGQTRRLAECGIEFAIRKRATVKLAASGWARTNAQRDRKMRLRLNQHRDGLHMLKRNNAGARPFTNSTPL